MFGGAAPLEPDRDRDGRPGGGQAHHAAEQPRQRVRVRLDLRHAPPALVDPAVMRLAQHGRQIIDRGPEETTEQGLGHHTNSGLVTISQKITITPINAGQPSRNHIRDSWK